MIADKEITEFHRIATIKRLKTYTQMQQRFFRKFAQRKLAAPCMSRLKETNTPTRDRQ